jgi:Zn-dependent protease
MEPGSPFAPAPAPAPEPSQAAPPTRTGLEAPPAGDPWARDHAGQWGLGHDAQESPFEDTKPSWLKRRLGPIGAGLIALLAKLKAIVVLLPKLKLLLAFGTMFVSVVAWGAVYGWAFGAGVVALLFVHEMGHVIALRREGIQSSPPIFIPFMGAMIAAKSLGENALAEARVGLAGPILGSVGSVVCLFLWHATGNGIWEQLAYFGFLINLFNLIPMTPFDGGRAMAAMAPWMWGVGFVAMLALVFIAPSPFILIFLVLGGLDTRRRWIQRKQGGPEQEAYYRVTPAQRLAVGVVYVLLAALLVNGLHATYVPRSL